MLNRMTAVCVLVLLSGTIINSACSQDINRSGYTFDYPDRVYNLPKSLAEISGLTLLDRSHLGAIHDEKDDLFVIDIRTGEVTDRHDMGSRRDYEGVERVGDTVYVLSSSGTIYEIRDWKNNKQITGKYKTWLNRGHDTEGLAYDAASHRLLIACKEYPGKGLNGYRAVYAFDLEQKQLLPEPAFKIDLAQADTGKKKGWGRTKQIKPAALAVHPLTQQLFIISSVKRRMVVLNSDGTLAAVHKLPKEYFAQAEGMAFLPNGDLFISNERAGRKTATLLRFNYRVD
ncbi:MAG: SdiA-regulated domain-containing protein [Mariprofundaceae bacterium]|nr:SdiA-regulated domain-containing protein [Mariprofundaceae bacterium]